MVQVHVHTCAGYVVVNVLADLPPCEVDMKFASSHGFRFPQTSDAKRVSVNYKDVWPLSMGERFRHFPG